MIKLLLLLGLIITGSGIFYTLNQYTNIKTYCGTVIKIPAETVEINGKYNSVERYLLVNFDIGKVKAINVEPTTYYTASIGEKVCFKLQEKSMIDKPFPTVYFSLFIGFFLIFLWFLLDSLN